MDGASAGGQVGIESGAQISPHGEQQWLAPLAIVHHCHLGAGELELADQQLGQSGVETGNVTRAGHQKSAPNGAERRTNAGQGAVETCAAIRNHPIGQGGVAGPMAVGADHHRRTGWRQIVDAMGSQRPAPVAQQAFVTATNPAPAAAGQNHPGHRNCPVPAAQGATALEPDFGSRAPTRARKSCVPRRRRANTGSYLFE